MTIENFRGSVEQKRNIYETFTEKQWSFKHQLQNLKLLQQYLITDILSYKSYSAEIYSIIESLTHIFTSGISNYMYK